MIYSKVSDDGEDGGGTRRDKPNQFDSLCDGVLNNLALVHSAMGEVYLILLPFIHVLKQWCKFCAANMINSVIFMLHVSF